MRHQEKKHRAGDPHPPHQLLGAVVSHSHKEVFTNPWFLRGGHAQTLAGYYGWRTLPNLPKERLEVDLGDGDKMLVHVSTPENWQKGDPCALLLHGLTGSHQSGHVVRLAAALFEKGWKVGCPDLRGAGDGFHLATKLYHGGRSDDALKASQALLADNPGSPLAVIGFSLGGNIGLKLALESAGNPLPQLAAVAAICPPVDLKACVDRLCRGTFRLYDRVFYKELRLDWERRQALFPQLPRVVLPKRGTVRIFDTLVTAPMNGFPDPDTYYALSGTVNRLPDLKISGLIVAAKDDPVVTIDPLIHLAAHGNHPPQLELEITPGGGHLGFVGRGKDTLSWAERRVADWLLARF